MAGYKLNSAQELEDLSNAFDLEKDEAKDLMAFNHAFLVIGYVKPQDPNTKHVFFLGILNRIIYFNFFSQNLLDWPTTMGIPRKGFHENDDRKRRCLQLQWGCLQRSHQALNGRNKIINC